MNIFVRYWPNEDAEVVVMRRGGKSTVVLFRQARADRPRIVLDSIGPVEQVPQEMITLMESFDVWALNAPNAPGAACSTMSDYRTCRITEKDYSMAMRVERRGQIRVQRYTHLEQKSSHPARALADYVLAWARRREGRT